VSLSSWPAIQRAPWRPRPASARRDTAMQGLRSRRLRAVTTRLLAVFSGLGIAAIVLSLSSDVVSGFCGGRLDRHRDASRGRLGARAVTDRASALRTLGLEESVEAADIKKAFRRMALRLHPDLQGGDAGRFTEAVEAYALLTDRGLPSTASYPTGSAPRWATSGSSRWNMEDETAEKPKEDGKWKFNSQYGYDPEYLEDVWAEIGFDPYTGTYYKPQAHADDDQVGTAGAAGSAYASYASYAAYADAARRAAGRPASEWQDAYPSSGSPQPGVDKMLIMQILGYSLCTTLSICVLLHPETLTRSGVCDREEAFSAVMLCPQSSRQAQAYMGIEPGPVALESS